MEIFHFNPSSKNMNTIALGGRLRPQGAIRTRRIMAALMAASAVLCVPNVASAAENDALSASLAAFGDAAAARRLEDQIADLVKKRNQAGMTRLVGQIAQNDGAFMEKMGSLTQAKNRVPDPEMARSAMALGPCHHAGFLLRKMAFALADGQAKPIIRNGVIMIDGTHMDDMYAEQMSRCERLAKQPMRKIKIGSMCSVNGSGCDEDPDMD